MKAAVRSLGMLIVLNGTSSSGKTTLAKAMLEQSDRALLHLEADRFAPVLRLNLPAKDAEFRARFTLAMHEAIAAFGRSVLDIIVDGSLPTEPELRDDCLAILREVPDTRVVAVRCSVAEFRKRESARGDRPVGWAEEQAQIVYEGVDFNETIDTTNGSAREHASTLLQRLFPA